MTTNTTTDYDDAYDTWLYRNVPCVVYRIDIPPTVRWIAYVSFADEWIEALDSNGQDADEVYERVEDEVDRLVMVIQDDRDDPFGTDPIDEFPDIDPDPDSEPDSDPNRYSNPRPFVPPFGPYYDEYPTLPGGSDYWN
jgi:hypothetical protein